MDHELSSIPTTALDVRPNGERFILKSPDNVTLTGPFISIGNNTGNPFPGTSGTANFGFEFKVFDLSGDEEATAA